MKRKMFREVPMARLNDQQGAIAVTVALVMAVMLAMTALALDVGHALVARNQLQNASDAAALAGARALGVIYGGMTGSLTGYTLSGGNVTSIMSAATVAAADNQAAGVTVAVNAGDIAIGNWTSATRTFAPTMVLPRAVRVITRRDSSANGPISTFLAGVMGFTNVSVTAVATAQLSPVSVMAPGDMNAPFGISEFYFNSGFGCGSTIQFSPSIPGNPQTCAGWQVYEESPFSNSSMMTVLNGMINGTYTPPSGQAGVTDLNFGNGNLGNPAWSALTTLWQNQVALNGAWNAYVPVYAGSDCSPSGAQLIVGFATVKITYVGGPGDPNNSLNCSGGNVSTGCIAGTIQCDVFQGSGGSGGGAYGTFGTIPGLVE